MYFLCVFLRDYVRYTAETLCEVSLFCTLYQGCLSIFDAVFEFDSYVGKCEIVLNCQKDGHLEFH